MHKHNWQDKTVNNIISGKSADGVALLGLFLKDYSKEFNIKTLNANCRACISTYLQNYKSKFYKMDSNCDYILHKKREGLPLGFGASIFVTNANITNEYAEKLIKNYTKLHESKGEVFELGFLFDKFPKREVKKVVIDKLDIDVTPIKKEIKRKTRNKKK